MLLLQFAEIGMHQLIIALFWMLMHSLWQGLLASALAFILLHSFKKISSKVRYGILTCCLSLFIIGATYTFIIEIKQSVNSTNSIVLANDQPSFHFKTQPSIISNSSKMNLYAFSDEIANKYAFYIVLGWFICYLFYCTRFVSGLIYINKLSSDKLPADKTWSSTLSDLQNELGINKLVRIFHSKKVQVPVIIGIFKPIILIPVAVANQLPIAEVEAILLHELAHIRRNDFLINLIQSLIDQVFFFNPAVRWMSSQLREEREKCCDDIVLIHSLEKDAYINALVRFQELMVARPAFEMALGNNKFQLFKRIRRIVNKENTKSTFMDKTILFFSILSIAALGFMSGNITKQAPNCESKIILSSIVKPLDGKPAQFVRDTVPDKKEVIEKEKTKAEIKSKIDQEVREQIEQSRKEMELKKQSIMDQKLKLEHEMNEYKLMNENREIAQKDQMEQLMKMKEGELNAEKIGLQQREIELQQQVFQKELQKKIEELNKEREHMSVGQLKELDEKLMDLKKEAELKNMQMRDEMAYLQNMKNQQMMEQMQMQREQLQQLKMDQQRNRRTSVGQGNSEVDEIVSELLESKIIENTDPLSFKLDSRRLIVNDKKQGQEVFNKLKERFIHNSSDFIEYSHHGGSTSTTIHKD